MRQTGIGTDAAIRDSLYDLVPLDHRVLAILADPAFLRLDGIQQLGFAGRVWPGAKHTRFEHSIGVMHLMRRGITTLRERDDRGVISDQDAATGLAAALLHDIGHYPFSHAIEELGAPVRSHEAVGREIIEHGSIAPILREVWDADPSQVSAMIDGDPTRLTAGMRALRGLLSGTLDVDKLDYLPRDARACNVPYGGVDTERLLGALDLREITPGEPTVVLRSKGISPLHSLINARQEMFDNVYWHHTNRACMAMLLRAIQEGIIASALSAEDLTLHTDASLLAMLTGPAMPESTQSLARALTLRRLHKRAIEVSTRATHLFPQLSALWFDPTARRQVELRMVERLSAMTTIAVGATDILIDIPKPEKWKTDVWVVWDTPPIGMEPIMHWHDVVGMNDVDLKRYEDHRRMIRIVAAEHVVDAVRQNWEQILISALEEHGHAPTDS